MIGKDQQAIHLSELTASHPITDDTREEPKDRLLHRWGIIIILLASVSSLVKGVVMLTPTFVTKMREYGRDRINGCL